ncbi:MAG: alkaline phosphatase family protein [Acidimicrobiia bacterium]
MTARVMLIGLDAVDPTLFCELAGRGELPNTAALLAASPARQVVNPDGVYVGAVWPTLYTGTSPGVHGRTWPGRLHPHSYQVRPFEWSSLGADPLWVTLARAGRRVAVIDAPHAAAADLAGLTQIADWGGHEPSHGFHASSAALEEDVRARFGAYPVDDCDRYGMSGRLDELAHDMRDGVERKTALSTDLVDRADWDLFFTVFTEGHCAGHQCWHVHDAGHPSHDPAQRDVIGDPIVDVYRQLDGSLGEMLAHADDDTEVVVLLSHGMAAHHDGTFLVGEILRRLERAWGRQPSRWATRRDQGRHAWNRISRRAGLRPRTTWVLDGSRPFIRAPNASLCAAVRISVAGREPAGAIAPGDYEDVCAALTAEFLALENVETGDRAVTRVLRPRDLFDGPHVDEMPDLLVEWRQDQPIRALASPTIGRIDGEYAGHRTGDHRRDGLLLRRGPSATADVGSADSVVDARDLAPTVQALVGEG